MKATLKIEVTNIEEINSAIAEVAKKADDLQKAVQRLDELELEVKTSFS
ncbi:TPA: hypothetical protein U1C24_000921 [Streptococcus suis]|nr:hypothetical protein [Streptococcus suis]HEM3626014.1 hypothetical protein [Streptococcus suis]HEM3630348.1 hypothetical protein [Streptococcus suis]HEM3643823.1 hypothetical protein [Streptococcus suis]